MAAILVIETSTEVCSVALTVEGAQTDVIESKEGQNHDRLVTVYADDLLRRNYIKPEELVAVAVSKGPGSYTGLRIGVSMAKGICFARHIPLIAIGTLEAMTWHVMQNRKFYNIPEDKPTLFCPMIDARRMEVFSMLYKEDGSVRKQISAEIVDEDFLSVELSEYQIVFFGNGSEKCSQALKSPNALFVSHVAASAKYLCDLVWHLYNKNQFEDVAYFEPFYLKDFVATVSKKNIPG
jgi:tRNA threonylcarbamoyladenosine biosynthesis protein TsaB